MFKQTANPFHRSQDGLTDPICPGLLNVLGHFLILPFQEAFYRIKHILLIRKTAPFHRLHARIGMPRPGFVRIVVQRDGMRILSLVIQQMIDMDSLPHFLQFIVHVIINTPFHQGIDPDGLVVLGFLE